MGTSVSHRSPDTHNWRAVAAGYLSEKVPIDRVSQEVWRAATNQPQGNLPLSLAAPIIAQCLRSAMVSSSPQEATRNVSRLIAESGEASLATDIARRAAISSFAEPGNRRMNFVTSLFSDVADYLVARDLPGYVGTGDRIKNISASIAFKENIKRQVESILAVNPAPENIEANPDRWKAYVMSQIRNLAKTNL
jgi:hypothetical protein